MSPNLDLVRSTYADWERGDFSSTDRAHPDIEFVIAEGPDSGSWKGVAGAFEAWRDFLGAWEGYRVKVDKYRELDSERVFVFTQRIGRGKTSGLEVGQMQRQAVVVGNL
jgi:ketosteroid isomerase-like protein